MIIATQYPIYSVEKLEVGIVPGNESIETPIDITAWSFKKTVYVPNVLFNNKYYPVTWYEKQNVKIEDTKA